MKGLRSYFKKRIAELESQLIEIDAGRYTNPYTQFFATPETLAETKARTKDNLKATKNKLYRLNLKNRLN
jgi:hypothetical protein